MKLLILAAASMAPSATALAAPAHPCAEDARAKAKALLSLHMDGADMNVGVSATVTRRPPVKSLKGKGRFDVLEVMGYVYKAQYRIRMIYAQIPDSCVLMGQEIIEIANPY